MPVDMDREVWEMGKKQSQIIMQLGALDKAIRRSHDRIDRVNDTLRDMTKRDERQDAHIAAIQDALGEFHVTLGDVQKALRTLRRLLGGAGALVAAMGVLAGILGAEVFPVLFKHMWTLLGL